jgi:hypothetical protein
MEGREGDRAAARRLHEEELRGRREKGSRDRSEFYFPQLRRDVRTGVKRKKMAPPIVEQSPPLDISIATPSCWSTAIDAIANTPKPGPLPKVPLPAASVFDGIQSNFELKPTQLDSRSMFLSSLSGAIPIQCALARRYRTRQLVSVVGRPVTGFTVFVFFFFFSQTSKLARAMHVLS